MHQGAFGIKWFWHAVVGMLAVVTVTFLWAALTESAVHSAAAAREARSFVAPSIDTSNLSAPTVAFFGDSFVVGVGAPTGQGYVSLLQKPLGVSTTAFGQIGTGFVNKGTGQPYGDRLAAVLATHPAALVIQGSVNDTGSSTTQVVDAAKKVLNTVHSRDSHLPVAVVGPIFLSNENQPDVLRLRQALKNLAGHQKVTYVDPTGWITDGTAGKLIGSDHLHPTPAGYQVIAADMAKQLKPFLKKIG